MLTLVLGGRRSGKSLWAENEALKLPAQKRLYLATAKGLEENGLPDASMQARIEAHRARRGPDWQTLEEPLYLVQRLEQEAEFDVLLLDCVSVWLSNLMLAGLSDEAVLKAGDNLARFLAQRAKGDLPRGQSTATPCPKQIFVVSNEVGLGVAPATELGNRFCDLAGSLNQCLARAAQRVVFIAAGLPLALK